MTTALAPSQVVLSEQLVLDALTAAGFRLHDGWFYPSGDPSRAVVRLTVYGDQYQIWRRRKLQSPWMLITTADCQDFDRDSFETWRTAWPLTH